MAVASIKKNLLFNDSLKEDIAAILCHFFLYSGFFFTLKFYSFTCSSARVWDTYMQLRYVKE